MTQDTFQRCMSRLSATWPNREVTHDTLEAYWLVFQGLPDEAFEIATTECVATCTYYPVPAEIMARVRARAEAALTSAGLLPDSAEGAWARVLEALNDWHPDTGWLGLYPGYEHLGRVGGVPCPLPPLIREAVEAIGGMERVFLADFGDLGFVRREFMDFYEQRRQQEIQHMPALMTVSGKALQEPVVSRKEAS